ncbi:hypothetical protein VHEMI09085 [[Torrubiella] hemipterigena]|uniref:FAD-binding domain-containing protein n=1 Tax=[Torrubiella] hemipterigena TaxID=1531966 RepID=A0A0A1TPN8_9HYPO|nr:hypothetical protein VHEMI09085 [[Torrubiella] hemipterigena]
MSIPEECTVLVIGGGPAGSYAASVLAREGVDTVVLEAETFPRYHIGESLLPSFRYFLKFIDLDEKFDQHGFLQKHGASFKFNSLPPGYTNFVAAGGAGNYSWNVIRSEADQLLFEHAGKSGAKVFDGVKVTAVGFEPAANAGDLGRPVSASWKRNVDGECGTVRYKYLIDASGRSGMISTKYLKNRKYNQGLKSVASWGYWESAGSYGPTPGDPISEAIQDGSGWAWFIPLHDGSVSVGIIIKQELLAQKKQASGTANSREFYLNTLKQTSVICKLLETAHMRSDDIKTASDWSYRASDYASPYLRIAGDAGCFIDPFFSSGVHLAMNSALSAATTICASLRGHCSEDDAVAWHSRKVAEAYTRFLMVVSGSLEQVYAREVPILNEVDEPGFDTAFEHFKPIIQGTIDAGGKLSATDVSQSIEFCTSVIEKIESGCLAGLGPGENAPGGERGCITTLSPSQHCDETMMKIVRLNRVLDLDTFAVDVIHGMAPNMQRGNLGLAIVSQAG